MTQLRDRFWPEIFLMRDSGLTSTSPNLAKSTFGQGSRSSTPPPVTPPAAAATGPEMAPDITPLTYLLRSSLTMRPFGPLAGTLDRSTPSSRAKARTDGEAWTLAPIGRAGARAAGAAGAATGSATGAAACGAAAGAAAPAPVSTLISTTPSLTLEPSWTSTSLTVPETVDGTSMVALSDSNVAIASSTLIESPTLTKRSMTGTSEKSPISGTLTSTIPPPAAGAAAGATGAAAGAAAGAGAAACAAGAGAGAAAAAPVSTLISTVPSPTLEPSWTSTSLTTPSTVEGTSMVALSDSRVAIASSILMLSPTLTYSSMTGTSEKSPISGTLTSMIWLMLSLPIKRSADSACSGQGCT